VRDDVRVHLHVERLGVPVQDGDAPDVPREAVAVVLGIAVPAAIVEARGGAARGGALPLPVLPRAVERARGLWGVAGAAAGDLVVVRVDRLAIVARDGPLSVQHHEPVHPVLALNLLHVEHLDTAASRKKVDTGVTGYVQVKLGAQRGGGRGGGC